MFVCLLTVDDQTEGGALFRLQFVFGLAGDGGVEVGPEDACDGQRAGQFLLRVKQRGKYKKYRNKNS